MKLHEISAKLADEGIRNGELAYAIDKGRNEGRVEGEFLLITKMLQNGFSWDIITKGTGISQDDYEHYMNSRKP